MTNALGRVMRMTVWTGTVALLAACSGSTAPEGGSDVADGPPGGGILPDPASLTECRDAFEVWAVDGTAALNSGADPVDTIVAMEGLQRRVFDLCSLQEAEELNQSVLVDGAPMIEPDFQSFVEVECVDESPLFDDTRLCDEVAQ